MNIDHENRLNRLNKKPNISHYKRGRHINRLKIAGQEKNILKHRTRGKYQRHAQKFQQEFKVTRKFGHLLDVTFVRSGQVIKS